MGILDSLLGRTRIPKANEDRLFGMSTAAIDLEAGGLKPAGRAGLVFKRLPPGRFERLEVDLKQLLQLQGAESGVSLTTSSDDFGFEWLILEGGGIQELLACLHSAAQSLIEDGLGDLLLAAAFRFDQGHKPVYWVYGYKAGTYYPFVPVGSHKRDNAEEIRLAAMGQAALPVEKDTALWYAIWGAPL